MATFREAGAIDKPAVQKPKGKPGAPKGNTNGKGNAGKARHTGGPGRPGGALILTRKLGTAICDHIATGTPKRFAALAEGVSDNTVHEWVARGEGRDPQRPATEMTRWFAAEMRKAEATDVNRRKVRLDKIADGGDPRVDMWWLERRHPEEFGRVDRMEIAGDAAKPIRVELAFDPSPLVEAVAARRALSGPRAIDVQAEEIT